MTLHMVVGPPASGKSTFVAQNAGANPRFDFDAVASTVAGITDTGHDIPAPVTDTVLAMRRGLMGWCLDAETNPPELWVINSNPSQSTIDRWVAASGVFHLCDPGLEECLARAARAGRPDWTEDVIRGWYAAPPSLPEDHTKKGGPRMRTKDFTVRVKSPDEDSNTDDDAVGEIEAYASVFGNRDSYGDIVVKGAFTETLAEWEESGNTLPLLYGHDFKDPFSNIGAVTSAAEDDHGLKITARLDLTNEKAAQVYHLLKEKRLSQMSFAFDILDAAEVQTDGEWSYEIRRVKLYECSVVPIGANQATEIVAVKSGDGHSSGGEPSADNVGKARRLLAKAVDLLISPPGPDEDDTDDSADEDPAPVDENSKSATAALKARLAVLALKECS